LFVPCRRIFPAMRHQSDIAIADLRRHADD